MDCHDCKEEMEVETYLTLQIMQEEEVMLECDIPMCPPCLIVRESELSRQGYNAL
jgi:hypothetical protein